MRYDLSKESDMSSAADYLAKLAASHSTVNITKVNPKRSLNQNAYLHLTFGIFGLETGWSIAESKIIYKRYACPRLYLYEKGGIPFVKSSADLDTKEMTDSIDMWRKYASEQGVHIPLPGEDEALTAWGNRIEQEGKYL